MNFYSQHPSKNFTRKRVSRTNLVVALIAEERVNSSAMGIVLVPEKTDLYLPLSVLIVVKRLQCRLNPVGTDQSIVEIVTKRGATATKIATKNTLWQYRGVNRTPLFLCLLLQSDILQ